MTAKPRHGAYDFGGCKEYMLSFDGQDTDAARLLIILPLFDEMNRTRRTLVETMRLLSNLDISSALPDLPGCNESEAALEEQSLSIWHEAIKAAAVAHSATHILSLRGGCLIDDIGLPAMRIAPVKGASLLKKMVRTRIAGDKEAGLQTSAETLENKARLQTIELAGNNIGPQLWTQLEEAEPSDSDTAHETKIADISGSALWLRAEPHYDAEMAGGLAQALHDWMAAS